MVRNEADIIEWWARYNLRALNRLHVIDHHSRDNTVEILRCLQREGLPIILHQFEDVRHLQSEAMHQVALPLAVSGDVDFLVPLDADELISVDRDNLHQALKKMPDGYAGAMPWRTYLPEGNEELGCYFRRCTSYRTHEIADLAKLIIRASEYNECTRWGPGNHSFYNLDTAKLKRTIQLDFVLAHYPIRDLQQLQRKIFMGAMASRIKEQRIPSESWHWLQLEGRLKAHIRDGTEPDLMEIALCYAYSMNHDSTCQSLSTGGIDPCLEIECAYEPRPLSLEQLLEDVSQMRQAHANQLETIGFAQFNAGNQAYRDNNYRQAWQSYSDAVFLNPSLAPAHLGRARSMVALGHDSLGVVSFQELLSLDPTNYSGLLEYGHALRRLGDNAAAAETYRRAIAVSPQRYEAHLGLGRLLQERGDLEAGDLQYLLAQQAVLESNHTGSDREMLLKFVHEKIQQYKHELSSKHGHGCR